MAFSYFELWFENLCLTTEHMVFQVTGRVTYNGHDLQEFVPQRTAAYISQHDVHIGEMTVRETLTFSARCQGVGSSYG